MIASRNEAATSGAEVIAGREYLSVLSGPVAAALSTDDFEAKLSGRTLLIAIRAQASQTPQPVCAATGSSGDGVRVSNATEWQQAHCMVLDRGPEMPGSPLPAPPDSADLIVDGRHFAKSGPVWLGYLFSTNGSYLALFSTDARRLHRRTQTQSWVGEERTLEPQGQVLVDIYRTQDGVRVAAGKYRFTQDAAGSLAFWLDSRILVVPAGQTALLGVFPALSSHPVPFSAAPAARGGVKSSCFDNPSAVRILGLRDRGVDDDHNGKFEGVRVIANVDITLPGLYTFAFQLDNGRGQTIESDERTQVLEAGANEIAAFVPASAWRKNGESYKLKGIRFVSSSRARAVPFMAVPVRELRTQIRAAASFEPGGSRYEANTVKVINIDSNQDGLFDRLAVEVDFYSEWEGKCMLYAYLGNRNVKPGFDISSWSGDVKRGRNRAVFPFDTANFVSRLQPQPFFLAGAHTECENTPFTGPTNAPIQFADYRFQPLQRRSLRGRPEQRRRCG